MLIYDILCLLSLLFTGHILNIGSFAMSVLIALIGFSGLFIAVVCISGFLQWVGIDDPNIFLLITDLIGGFMMTIMMIIGTCIMNVYWYLKSRLNDRMPERPAIILAILLTVIFVVII